MMGNRTALLVIDVQLGLFTKPIPIYRSNELLQVIGSLVDRAHMAKALVAYIQHENKHSLPRDSDAWQLHPTLQPIKGDIVIAKQSSNAFFGTPLHSELISRDINRVVVTGLVTHGCVKATCTGAKELGYDVVLVSDGHSSFHEKAADLITEWNDKLSSNGIVDLRRACDVVFGKPH